jgi:hypothetical protein
LPLSVEVCTPVSETGPCGRRSSWSITSSGSQFDSRQFQQRTNT